MKTCFVMVFFILPFYLNPFASFGKDLPKYAVWDLEPRNIPAPHARELTSILVSEISKLGRYEVYSQENVRVAWVAWGQAKVIKYFSGLKSVQQNRNFRFWPRVRTGIFYIHCPLFQKYFFKKWNSRL